MLILSQTNYVPSLSSLYRRSSLRDNQSAFVLISLVACCSGPFSKLGLRHLKSETFKDTSVESTSAAVSRNAVADVNKCGHFPTIHGVRMRPCKHDPLFLPPLFSGIAVARC